MSPGNGTQTIDPRDASTALADAILLSLEGATPRGAPSPPAPPSLLAFVSALDQAMAARPALARKVEENLVRSARAGLVASGVAVPSLDDFLDGIRRPPATTPRGGTVARAFWWGFHIEISHQDLQVFLGAAQPINEIIGAIGGGVPSPAAPFIAIAAAFIAGALGLLRSLDRGRGVYVSMTWFVPGIFIPTSV